jgi:hypothetical protein
MRSMSSSSESGRGSSAIRLRGGTAARRSRSTSSPHIDRFEANGYSREEMKIVWETRKILGLPELPVTATAVRVPVRIGHAAAVNVTLSRPLEPGEARELWSRSAGVEVVDDPALNRYPTPLAAAGRDAVLVGRARRDISQRQGLEFLRRVRQSPERRRDEHGPDRRGSRASGDGGARMTTMETRFVRPPANTDEASWLAPILLGAMLGSLVAGRLETGALCAAVAVGLAARAGARLPSWRWSVPLALTGVFAWTLNLYLTPGRPIAGWPAWFGRVPTQEGLVLGALLELRLVGALAAVLGLRAAWPGERAADEAARWLRPLARIGVPVAEARVLTGLALRFAPLLREEGVRIARVQDLRAGRRPRGLEEWFTATSRARRSGARRLARTRGARRDGARG